MQPSFLILCGDGVNCEKESALALEHFGARTKILHINELLKRPSELEEHQGLILPGGFSFGDELGSGQLLSLKLQAKLEDGLRSFLQKPKAILGICNGFQVLVKLGLLPSRELGRASVDLRANSQGRFINRWCELEITQNHNSYWLPQNLERLWLPIRHAEGRLSLQNSEAQLEKLKNQNQLPLRYLEDVNGSTDQLAALSDPTGWVLGLMPHPEAACFSPQLPRVLSQTKPAGAYFFEQIISSLNQV